MKLKGINARTHMGENTGQRPRCRTNMSICFNTKRKQQSMKIKSSHDAAICCIFTRQIASTILLTPEPGLRRHILLPRSWTMAEVISPSHMQVNTFVCRSKVKMRTVYWKIGKRDCGTNEGCMKRGTKQPYK